MDTGNIRQDLPEGREGPRLVEPNLTLEVNGAEIAWIFQMVQVHDVNLGDPESPVKDEPIARALLVKLAREFLKIVGSNGIDTTKVFSIWVTEKEVWLIKHRVGIADKFCQKDVGLSILLKIARLMITFDAGTASLPIAGEGDQTYEEATKRRKGRDNATSE